MDTKFKKLILDFIIELNTEYSFHISIDRILKIFDIYGSFDFFDENEIISVLKSLLCMNQSQYEIFEKIFHNYFYNLKNKTKYETEKYLIKNQLEELTINLETKEEEFEEKKQNFLVDLNLKELDYSKMFSKISPLIDKIEIKSDKTNFSQLFEGNFEYIVQICRDEKTDNVKNEKIRQIENDIENILLFNIETNCDIEISQFLLDFIENIKKVIENYEKMTEEHSSELKDISLTIKKLTSINHREEFIQGKNAVQTEKGYLYKDLKQLSPKDLNIIIKYIMKNASKFRTRISKNLKISSKERFDYKRVIKNSIKTDMTPMELFYKKQSRRRIKIICITDISGSCKAASQVLLSFVYALQEAFPGGVESFVFVKQLEEATDVFKNYSFTEANERTSVLVERDYSDYYTALKQFDEKFFYKITKDTIVIYLGDARNNKNNTGIEFLEKIKKKISSGYGKMYWLNPDEKCNWDKGDSIISMYSKYMDNTIYIKNSMDLIQFLNNICI